MCHLLTGDATILGSCNVTVLVCASVCACVRQCCSYCERVWMWHIVLPAGSQAAGTVCPHLCQAIKGITCAFPQLGLQERGYSKTEHLKKRRRRWYFAELTNVSFLDLLLVFIV